MKIEIFGTGCAKCKTLAAVAEAAAKAAGIEYEMVKVDQLAEIVQRGVMFTPAMAVDGEVKVAGKIPTEAEIGEILIAAKD